MRTVHRKDNKHDEIKAACQMFYLVVIDNSQRGPLDLFVYDPRKAHFWYWLEVKDGKYWKLTPEEKRHILAHPEHSRIVECAGDIQLLVLGKLPKEATINAAIHR